VRGKSHATNTMMMHWTEEGLTRPSTSSAKDEAENLRVVVESIHESLSLVNTSAAIETSVSMSIHIQKCFQNVQHLTHLSKN
jgi:hypothetical protein